MDEELKYSDNGLLNKNLFFENQIDFYVEDKDNEYRYASIFKKLFNVKIDTVFGLGGKNNLKKKYEELKKHNDLEKSFFIADADFDFLLEKEIINDKHFIYLEKYEIENYIIDENAIITFLMNGLKCMETKAENELDYKNWLNEAVNKLYRLFILFLVVQKLDLGLKNTEENGNKYFKETGNVNEKQIDKYYQEVKNKISIENPELDLDTEIEEMKEIVKSKYNNEWSKLIKGKYIITGIRKHLSNILRENKTGIRQVNEKQFIDFLFNFFDKEQLFFIKERVEKCLKNEKAKQKK